LGVEGPAFGIRIQIEVVFAERRQAGEFLRDRKLQVMSGNAFVVSDGFDVQQQSFFGGVLVDVDASGARAVSGADRIIGGRSRGAAKRFHRDDCQLVLWQTSEQLRQLLVHLVVILRVQVK